MVVSLLLLSRVMSSCKSLVAVPKGPLGTAQICWLTPKFNRGDPLRRAQPSPSDDRTDAH